MISRRPGASFSNGCGTTPRGYSSSVPARGDARRYSDIDIAILPAEPLPPELLFEIEEALGESDVLYLADLSEAPAPLRERFLR